MAMLMSGHRSCSMESGPQNAASSFLSANQFQEDSSPNASPVQSSQDDTKSDEGRLKYSSASSSPCDVTNDARECKKPDFADDVVAKSENGDVALKSAFESGMGSESKEGSGSDGYLMVENSKESSKKRERVENIVTNIMARDNVASSMSGDALFSSPFHESKNSFPTNATSLQEKTLDALRKTANFNSYNKKIFEEKFAFNVLKDFRNQDALNLAVPGMKKMEDPSAVLSCLKKHLDKSIRTEAAAAAGIGSSESPCSKSKKPRYDSNCKAAVRIASQSDRQAANQDDDDEYSALVETLKKEMMASFEKVAEQSVRRLLEKLVKRKQHDSKLSDDHKSACKQQRIREKSASSYKQDVQSSKKIKRKIVESKTAASEDSNSALKKNVQNQLAENNNTSFVMNTSNQPFFKYEVESDNLKSSKLAKSESNNLLKVNLEEIHKLKSFRAVQNKSYLDLHDTIKNHAKSDFETESNAKSCNKMQQNEPQQEKIEQHSSPKSIASLNSASESGDSAQEKNDDENSFATSAMSSQFWAPFKRDASLARSLIGISNNHSDLGSSTTNAFAQQAILQGLQHPWQQYTNIAAELVRQQQQLSRSETSHATNLLWPSQRQSSDFKPLNAAMNPTKVTEMSSNTNVNNSVSYAPSLPTQLPPFMRRGVPPFIFPMSMPSTSTQPQNSMLSSQMTFPLVPNFPQYPFLKDMPVIGNRKVRTGIDMSQRTTSGRISTCDPRNKRTQAHDISPYSAASIQEGLTPQHLKKAKLMFFYTRYPSANTLKTYFSDVKFTRATTSQLIKWFSNFREFYYIQMEKFARQALAETTSMCEMPQLQVTRSGELFRALNLHYNKSNEFRVPDRFLSITHTSLREFFVAIQNGKDNEPSWKKVIYKVICKLDQDIPEIFKSPNVLDRLEEIVE